MLASKCTLAGAVISHAEFAAQSPQTFFWTCTAKIVRRFAKRAQDALRVNLQQQTRLQRLRPSGGDRDGCRTSARRALQALSRRSGAVRNPKG